MNERDAVFVDVIGSAGRGKTTQVHTHIKNKVANGERCLVIVPDGAEKTWHEYPIIYPEDLEDQFDPNFTGVLILEWQYKVTFPFLFDQFKTKGLRNLNLVLDDPTYAEKHPEEQIRKILARKRQWGIDIFSSSHSYDQIPTVFFNYITIFGVGYTLKPIVTRKDTLDENFEVHKQSRLIINQITGTDPKGKNFHNFYYMDVQGILIGKDKTLPQLFNK